MTGTSMEIRGIVLIGVILLASKMNHAQKTILDWIGDGEMKPINPEYEFIIVSEVGKDEIVFIRYVGRGEAKVPLAKIFCLVNGNEVKNFYKAGNDDSQYIQLISVPRPEVRKLFPVEIYILLYSTSPLTLQARLIGSQFGDKVSLNGKKIKDNVHLKKEIIFCVTEDVNNTNYEFVEEVTCDTDLKMFSNLVFRREITPRNSEALTSQHDAIIKGQVGQITKCGDYGEAVELPISVIVRDGNIILPNGMYEPDSETYRLKVKDKAYEFFKFTKMQTRNELNQLYYKNLTFDIEEELPPLWYAFLHKYDIHGRKLLRTYVLIYLKNSGIETGLHKYVLQKDYGFNGSNHKMADFSDNILKQSHEVDGGKSFKVNAFNYNGNDILFCQAFSLHETDIYGQCRKAILCEITLEYKSNMNGGKVVFSIKNSRKLIFQNQTYSILRMGETEITHSYVTVINEFSNTTCGSNQDTTTPNAVPSYNVLMDKVTEEPKFKAKMVNDQFLHMHSEYDKRFVDTFVVEQVQFLGQLINSYLPPKSWDTQNAKTMAFALSESPIPKHYANTRNERCIWVGGISECYFQKYDG